MNLLVALGEEIKLAMTLPHTVPIRLPKLAARSWLHMSDTSEQEPDDHTVYRLYSSGIGYADLVGRDPNQFSIVLMQARHYTVSFAAPRQ